MIGLGYIILFVAYFFVARTVVHFTTKWASNNNKSVRLWRIITIIGMLSIVFWDLIPIYGTHTYQCASNGGFSVYKTLDEWKKDNPGVAETLVPVDGAKSTQGGETIRYQLNQRFAWDTTRSQVWYTLYKKDEQIVDIQTGEVLAEYIDFYTNLINPMVIPTTQLRDFKMWMKINSCEKSGRRINRKRFYQFEAIIENLGEGR